MVDFGQVYSWINLFEIADNKNSFTIQTNGIPKITFLKPCTQEFREQLQAARNANDRSEVWNIIERINNICLTFADNVESAEAKLECAYFVYSLGEFEDALNFLDDAIFNYFDQNQHNVAIAYWMKGLILWQRPSKHDQAVGFWRRALEVFQKIKEETPEKIEQKRLLNRNYNLSSSEQKKIEAEIEVLKKQIFWYSQKIPSMTDILVASIKKGDIDFNP